MKILIFSYYDGRSKDTKSFKDVALLTNKSKEEYCKKWEYDFLSIEIQEYDKEIGWYKIDEFLRQLRDYDYVFYCEADCLITNFTKQIEDIIDDKYDIIIAKNSISPRWTGINCGNLIIKNSEWSINFLEKLKNKKEFWHHNWAEQQALIDELEKDSDLLNNIKFVSTREMGGFHHQWYPKDNWQTGDWILHAAGCSNEHRYNLFNELKNKIVKDTKVDYNNWSINLQPFI
jgi:hypothetical protein